MINRFGNKGRKRGGRGEADRGEGEEKDGEVNVEKKGGDDEERQ